jgi:hypothetical protein
MVELYRRAGGAGFDVGNLRAGEALLARFGGPLIDPAGGAACPQDKASRWGAAGWPQVDPRLIPD